MFVDLLFFSIIKKLVSMPLWERKTRKPSGWTVNPQLRFGLTVHPSGLQFLLCYAFKGTIYMLHNDSTFICNIVWHSEYLAHNNAKIMKYYLNICYLIYHKNYNKMFTSGFELNVLCQTSLLGYIASGYPVGRVY